MRNRFYSTLMAIVIFGGCSVSKDFTFSIEKEFAINNYQSTHYTSFDTINATQFSSDFRTYKSDMTSVEIQSGSYTITYFSGPSTQKITNATISVSALDGSSTKVLATVSDVNLMSVSAITQPLTLTDDGKQFFQDQLKGASSSAVLTFSATTNEAPITFSVRFHFDVKVTYSKGLI